MDVFVELKAIITEFQAKMAEARGEMTETSEHGSSKFGALGKAGGAVLAGVAGAAIGIGAASVEMGNQLEDAQAKMDQAIKNTGGSLTTLAPAIDAADKKMESFGFTNAQTADAIAAGTTATGSSTKALDLLQTAANLAAFKHVDLSTAMVAVAKATEGQMQPLKQLGIDLPVAAGGAQKLLTSSQALAAAQLKMKQVQTEVNDHQLKGVAAVNALNSAHAGLLKAQDNFNQASTAGTTILGVLNQRLGGQAQAAAETFSGKMEVAKVRVEDLGAKLGEKLIPVIEKTITVLTNIVDWFEKHTGAAKVLAAGIITVTAALAAFGVVEAIVAANPISLIIEGIVAAVVALSIGIYTLVTHWKQVWADIKQWTDDAIGFLRTKFGTIILLLAGPIGWLALLALHWKQVWTGIKQITGIVVGDVLNFVKDMGNGFFTAIEGILGAASHLPFVGHYFAEANNAVHGFQSDFDSTLGGIASDASTWGQRTGAGLVQGMTLGMQNNQINALEQAHAIGSAAASAMRKGAAANSPSQKTIDLGRDMIAGLVIGLQNGAPHLKQVAQQTVSGAIPGASLPGFGAGTTSATLGPIGGGGFGGGAGGDLVLQMQGTEFARVAWPALWAQMLRQQRSTSLGIKAS